jgi:transposase
MPRCLELGPHLASEELERRYRACRDPVERSHWQMLWLVAQGYRCPAVAALVGYSEDWVRTIVHRYNADGPDGVTDRRRTNPGQRPLLTPALREELRAALATAPPDGGLWTSPKVAAWMAERLGRPISKQRGWEALHRLGFTMHQPRPQATTADPAAQDAFKKGGLPPRGTP